MKKWMVEYKDRGDYGCGEEVEDQEDGKWSIEGGPELDQEDQDTLNDAMDSMFNEDGESLRESMEKIKDKE